PGGRPPLHHAGVPVEGGAVPAGRTGPRPLAARARHDADPGPPRALRLLPRRPRPAPCPRPGRGVAASDGRFPAGQPRFTPADGGEPGGGGGGGGCQATGVGVDAPGPLPRLPVGRGSEPAPLSGGGWGGGGAGGTLSWGGGVGTGARGGLVGGTVGRPCPYGG